MAPKSKAGIMEKVRPRASSRAVDGWGGSHRVRGGWGWGGGRGCPAPREGNAAFFFASFRLLSGVAGGAVANNVAEAAGDRVWRRAGSGLELDRCRCLPWCAPWQRWRRKTQL
uniref:Uncharacterized protein n=1 Tax=Oryza sativa subsp. japonica TaxID=39947 RepID=Q6Z8J8_ORYSJ|nr:hypothetical protein [Oryza sativa Japonica Group]